MEVIHIRYPLEDETVMAIQPSVVAIGTFDGVHLGHRHVLDRTKRLSARLHCPPAAMTFDPHPRAVLSSDRSFQYLTPLREKLLQFERAGMELTYVVHFDRQLAAVSPRRFVEDVLVPLQLRGATVGYDYTFGHRASGKAEDLRQLCEGRLTVEIVPPFHVKGQKVSSTLLRGLLHKGDVQTVSQFLGRPYRIDGVVVRGAGRGKEIGFPTANLHMDDPYIVPRNGVYAVQVEWKGKMFSGAMSIGYNPTFEDNRESVSVEVYLLDFDGELYDERLYVNFLHYLRPERKFDSAEQLVRQMHEDVRRTRALIGQVRS